MSPINSLARVMGNANRFTINCQGETGPGRQAALGTFRNRLMHTGKRTASTVEVTGHRCQVTGKTASKGTLLPVTCYLLPVTCYLLPVTCYLLPVTCLWLPAVGFFSPGKLQPAENVKKADKMSVNSKSGGTRCRHGYVPIYYKLL